MNKMPALAGAFIFMPALIFALDLSTGYGVTLGANFDTLTAKINDGSLESRQYYNQFNFGGLIFFDIPYAMADIGFSGVATGFIHNNEIKKYTYIGENYEMVGANFSIGLYGKYPFNLERFVLFPVLGVQAIIGISRNFSKDFDGRNANKGDSYGSALDWSTIAFKAGAGFDLDINGSMFFRSVVLFNYRLNSSLDNAFLKAITDAGNPEAVNTNFGFEFEFLIGYRIGELPQPSTSARPQQNPENDDDDIFYPK